MESTGEYWRPVFNILEGNLEVMLVNARHIKAVPVRKTDIKDARRDRGTLTAWVITTQFYSPSPTKGLTRLNPPSQ